VVWSGRKIERNLWCGKTFSTHGLVSRGSWETFMSRMTTKLAGLLLAGSTALAAGAAQAQDAPKFTFSPNVGFTTDYIFRGVSQTARKPTGQGGFDVGYGIFYAGLWASGLRLGELDNGRTWANIEVDLYAGIKPVLGPFTFDLGVIYYAYPGSRTGTLGGVPMEDLNYVEAKAGVSVSPWKDGTVGATVFYSPEYTNKTGKVTTVEGTFSQVLPGFGPVVPTFSALLGYQKGSDVRYQGLVANGDTNYMYWNAGVNFALWEKASFDIRYWDTNISNIGNFCTGAILQCDSTVVGTFKLTF
jgi:uncharacterized protein (TIGR02001 family)